MPIISDIARVQLNFNEFRKNRLRFVGTIAVGFFKDDIFKAGGFIDNGLQKWIERKNQSTKKKRALLIYTGALRRSMRILRLSGNSITVGSQGIRYAQIHNTGGTITQIPTDRQRRFFWAQYRQTKNDMWKHAALAQIINIRIPQRKFIGQSAGLNKRIERQLTRELMRILETNL
ncbi:MAG: phage virion morphogenesis protein [Chitinophagales bacterium]|nr:phage virion morphogenesis protein [Chitinophagales bacterium]